MAARRPELKGIAPSKLNHDDVEDAQRLYRVLTRDPVPVSDRRATFDAVLEHSGTSVIGMEQGGQIIAMVMLLTGDARGVVGFFEKLGFSGHEKHGLVVKV